MDSQPYKGDEKIIIAIDLGTTHSAVSFTHAYPGSVVDVRMVTKWPGQPEAAGDSKIPTLVAYKNRAVVACGAEARDYVGDEEYEVAKWFKLHLHPDSMKISDAPPAYGSNETGTPTIEIPPLPTGVNLTQVYVAFLQYMFTCTKTFFETNTPNGVAIWNRLKGDMVIILATPNGWDTAQQGFMKRAAKQAGMVNSDEDADLRIEFVTEGEASVHYALARTHSQTWLRKGAMFAVTDAGGSTVDSTLYECKEVSPKLVLEEVCASECVQAGGVFVDRAAQVMLKEKLKDSRFGDDASIHDMVEIFEKKTKRLFNGTQDSNVIDFGGRRDNDRAHNIIQGKITLGKNEVASTFDDVSMRTVNSCLKLLRGRKIQHLLLVGGFGESPYLRSRLKDTFSGKGTEVVTVEEPSKKAAAEGATIWYTKQLVVARASRYTIGIDVCPPYDANNRDHVLRRSLIYNDADGRQRIPGEFEIWINKDFKMDQEFRKDYDCRNHYSTKPTSLARFSVEVLAWEGELATKWTNDGSGARLPRMRRLCIVQGDLSPLLPYLTQQNGFNGSKYWCVEYKVIITFGGTKLKARLQWTEGGRTREGPIQVVPDSLA
ncbi:hypothetical protein FRC19_001467 [Serendipita sp. 401]|nr:hypothetical protein FRC19_001467 [Serendipita sp. 401]